VPTAGKRRRRRETEARADGAGHRRPLFGGALGRQLADWAAAREQTPPREPAVLARAVRAWTRMHGVVSLELLGAFESMKLDGGELFAAEVESILS
jgi:hypothetical protein